MDNANSAMPFVEFDRLWHYAFVDTDVSLDDPQKISQDELAVILRKLGCIEEDIRKLHCDGITAADLATCNSHEEIMTKTGFSAKKARLLHHVIQDYYSEMLRDR